MRRHHRPKRGPGHPRAKARQRVRRAVRPAARLVVVLAATIAIVGTGAAKWSPAKWRGRLAPLNKLATSDLAARQSPDSRTTGASRSSDNRITAANSLKLRQLRNASGAARTHTVDLHGQDPRVLARNFLPRFGFSPSEFGCLAALWNGESGWRVHAENSSTGAYGIPQALPGSKMSSAGPDWRNNALTQIRWGLGYIKSTYGSPCAAQSFKGAHGWY